MLSATRCISSGGTRLTLPIGTPIDIFQRTPNGLLYDLVQAVVLPGQPGVALRLQLPDGRVWELAALPPLPE